MAPPDGPLFYMITSLVHQLWILLVALWQAPSGPTLFYGLTSKYSCKIIAVPLVSYGIVYNSQGD